MTQEIKTKIEAKAEEISESAQKECFYSATPDHELIWQSGFQEGYEQGAKEVINNPAEYLEQQPVSAVSEEWKAECEKYRQAYLELKAKSIS